MLRLSLKVDECEPLPDGVHARARVVRHVPAHVRPYDQVRGRLGPARAEGLLEAVRFDSGHVSR